MSKYQYSKLVMEKYLRRSFYDAVLELYETDQGTRIISVSLEGHLSLVVNRDESFIIKLNEVAQRADDREEQLSKIKEEEKTSDESGVKEEDEEILRQKYPVKKEEEFLQSTSCQQEIPSSDLDPEVLIEYENVASKISNVSNQCEQENETKEIEKADNFLELDKSKYDSLITENKDQKEIFPLDKHVDGSDDLENNNQTILDHQSQCLSEEATANSLQDKIDTTGNVNTEENICFLPTAKIDEFKRKLDSEGDQFSLSEKKKKKQRTSSVEEFIEEVKNLEVKNEVPVVSSGDDGTSGLQLLPHTGETLHKTQIVMTFVKTFY